MGPEDREVYESLSGEDTIYLQRSVRTKNMRIFCELLEPAEMQLNALFYLKSLTSLIDETLGTQVPLMQRLISCKDIPIVAFKAPALLLLGHPLATLVIKV